MLICITHGFRSIPLKKTHSILRLHSAGPGPNMIFDQILVKSPETMRSIILAETDVFSAENFQQVLNLLIITNVFIH